MKARSYQSEDVEKIFEEWKSVPSTLYVAATGLGKTFVMSEVVRRSLPKRALLLCHRRELIYQAYEAFTKRGIQCEIEKAELSASTGLFNRVPVVLATVQTLISGEPDRKRMHRFNPKHFDILLYDESHHSVSPGNKKIVDYFTSGNENLRVLGVTATPNRADETALGQIFETVVEPPRDILFGINEGWLVNIDQRFVSVSGLDFSHMRTTAGDLNSGDLSAVMEAESCIQGVVHPTLEILFNLPEGTLGQIAVPQWGAFLEPLAQRRRAIVFTVSVAQAEMLSGIFNRVVPDIASWVCGKTTDKDRDDILNKFKTGQTSILVNCGVTTEGYDNPEVDMIVMARPTKSQTLYTQMVGRGTRVLPGLIDDLPDKESRLEAIARSSKPVLTVVDLVGNSGKHKLICTADILGGNNTEEVVERVIKNAKESKGQFVITEALAAEEEKYQKELERRRMLEEARKRSVVARVIYKTTSIDPFNAMDITPARSRGWNDGKSLSPKQRALLSKQGINPDALTYAGGRQIIAEMFRRWNGALCTMKQAALIKKHYGNEHDTKTMTRKTATEIIDVLAKNHWRKPEPTNV